MAEIPPMEELEHGRAYRISCRNLVYGVWDATTKGFVGIREKLGREYLFTEYHYDYDANLGTVWRAEPDELCPLGDLSEGEFSTLCFFHQREVEWRPDDPSKGETPGWRYHSDDGSPLESDDFPRYKPNQELFDWLRPRDQAEIVRRLEEFERIVDDG